MNPMEEKHAKWAQKLLVFESRLAVSEMRSAKKEVFHERIVDQCKSCLEAFDPVDDDALHNYFSDKSHCFSLRGAKAEEFKNSIKERDGKKM